MLQALALADGGPAGGHAHLEGECDALVGEARVPTPGAGHEHALGTDVPEQRRARARALREAAPVP